MIQVVSFLPPKKEIHLENGMTIIQVYAPAMHTPLVCAHANAQ